MRLNEPATEIIKQSFCIFGFVILIIAVRDITQFFCWKYSCSKTAVCGWFVGFIVFLMNYLIDRRQIPFRHA